MKADADRVLAAKVRASELHTTARSAAARDQRVPAAWKRYGG